MTSTDREDLRVQLIEHEGNELKPYRCPAGKLTIGVGRNLDANGISPEESRYLLDNDINRVINQCVARFPWFPMLDPVRQRAIVDLVFNMGIGTFSTFTVTLSCFARGDHENAAKALERSQWYGQVGRRAPRVVAMVRTGEDPGL